jgi:pentatricopeptide repeat protein
LNLFKEVKITTDEYTYSILFKICAEIADQHSLEFGKLLFNKMPKKFHNDIVVKSSALYMFTKCDSLDNAEALFDRIDRDVVSYGSMMKSYNIKNQPEKTLELFDKMKEENINPNKVIFFLLLDALSQIGDLSLSESLICQIPQSFLSNLWIKVGLIDLWVKFLLISID